MNDFNQTIGPGGEIIDQPMGLQAQQPMGVQPLNYGQAAAERAAQALVQARFQMALLRPRNVLQARSKILDACRRPGFAESAIFRKPVGKKDGVQQYVEGPSIRFAEEAIRSLGNMDIRQQVVFEDDEKRVVCVTVMDLENNVAWPTEVAVSKRIERSFVKEGARVYGTRKNSYGKNVYIVDASEDEITTKGQAMVSKALRTAALRVVPGDILEEALVQIRETLGKKDQADPKAALKKVVDAFHALGISPVELEKFLGHSLDSISPAEIQDLRGVYQSVKDGDSNWHEVLSAATEDRKPKAEPKKEAAAEAKEPVAGDQPYVPAHDPQPTKAQSPAEKAKEKAAASSAKIARNAAGGTLDLE
jgi:hypothetical protein